jgi:hypothetical protein
MRYTNKSIILAISVLGIIVLLFLYIYKYFFGIVTMPALEGMESYAFTPQTLDQFIRLQNIQNPNTYFDLQQLSKQATEQDMEYYNTNAHWYWDEATEKAYQEDLQRNQLLREYPKGSYMPKAKIIYNQNIMKKILSWRAPEGEFLMGGVISGNSDYENNMNDLTGRGKFPYTSGLLPKGDAVVICNNNKISLQKNLASFAPVYAPLDYNLLPTLVPGFKFLRGACDPCVALKDTPDYSCPFTINNKEPSYIWKFLWGL